MTRTPERLSGPAQLSNTAATVYTVPPLTRTVIRNIHLENPPGGATRTVTISIGVDAAGTRILDAYPILTGAVQDHWAYYVLEAGEVVQAKADTGATVVMTMDGDELVPTGASYLVADTEGVQTNASNSTVNPEFVVADSAGSDVEIDGGDATLINVLADGWYSVQVFGQFQGATTLSDCALSMTGATGINGDCLSNGMQVNAGISQNFCQILFGPIVQLLAGDTLFVNAFAVSGTTWDFFPGGSPGSPVGPALTIIRLNQVTL